MGVSNRQPVVVFPFGHAALRRRLLKNSPSEDTGPTERRFLLKSCRPCAHPRRSVVDYGPFRTAGGELAAGDFNGLSTPDPPPGFWRAGMIPYTIHGINF